MQALDLDPELVAQLGIEVGKRLVEQEHRRIADQGAADRDPLPLAARELLGPALQQRLDLQHRRRLADPAQDLGLGRLRHLQPERQVLAHVHARIERVGLEHHGDAAILGLLPGDVALADPDLAAVDLEQARDRVQKRGLAAAGRPEQHQKLAGLDLEAQAVEDADAAEGDADLADRNPGHPPQPLIAPAAMPRTNQRPETK